MCSSDLKIQGSATILAETTEKTDARMIVTDRITVVATVEETIQGENIGTLKDIKNVRPTMKIGMNIRSTGNAEALDIGLLSVQAQ